MCCVGGIEPFARTTVIHHCRAMMIVLWGDQGSSVLAAYSHVHFSTRAQGRGTMGDSLHSKKNPARAGAFCFGRLYAAILFAAKSQPPTVLPPMPPEIFCWVYFHLTLENFRQRCSPKKEPVSMPG